MPNNVFNKLTFAADKAKEVFEAVCPDDKFDFEKLIPMPLNIYRGDLGRSDEDDFPQNWLTWSQREWGTRWNAYDQICRINRDIADIKFVTAWSVPYPIIAAFANKFNIPFIHRYYGEGDFWGIEAWHFSDYNNQLMRSSKLYNTPNLQNPLSLELRGYYYDADGNRVS